VNKNLRGRKASFAALKKFVTPERWERQKKQKEKECGSNDRLLCLFFAPLCEMPLRFFASFAVKK
jgi:hypothetical protein